MNIDEYKQFREDGIKNQSQLDQMRDEHNFLSREMLKDRKLFIISICITLLTLVVDIVFRFFGK